MSVIAPPVFPPASLVLGLHLEGLVTRVQADGPEMDRDLRLEVRRTGVAVRVELLGPYGAVELPLWHAVRVEGADRAVWVGPSRLSPDEHVCSFVCELMTMRPVDLVRRWRRLG